MPNKLSAKSQSAIHMGRKSWYRVLVIVALGSLFLLAGAFGYQLTRRYRTPKLVLLIADLEGAERQYNSSQMARSLRSTLSRDVKIIALKKAFDEAEGSAAARAQGVKHQAAIVVWGHRLASQAEAVVEIHVELLKPPKGVPEPSLIQSFAFQMPSSAQTSIPTLFTAGAVSYVIEDWDGVLKILGDILTSSSEQPSDSALSPIYALLADAHYAKGHFAQAIAHYDQALAIRPESAELLVKRGIAYGTQGDYDRAIKDFERAITLQRNLAEAYYHGGNAYYAKREIEMAIAYYDQALSKRPDYAEAYCNRALAHAFNGDYDRALQDLNQAIQIKPDFVRAYSNRGSIYYAQGDYDQAIADYDRVIALQSNFAEAYFNRGVTYMARGDRERAIRDLIRFLELSTDPSWQQIARQKLAELGVK